MNEAEARAWDAAVKQVRNRRARPAAATAEDALTDAWAAERFAARCAQDFRCVHPDRRWLMWTDYHWAAADAGEVTRAAIATARSIVADAGGLGLSKERSAAMAQFGVRRESRAGLEAMLALAAVQSELVVVTRDLDRHPMYLATPSGTVDLTTGTLCQPDPRDLLTKITGAAYPDGASCPTAACPAWERFLECVLPTPGLRAFIQRAVGHSLTGDVSEHALFFLYGPGRNGKSTFLAVLRRVLGDYAGSAPFDLLLTTRGEQHPTALADLAGRRLVVAVEAGAGRSLNEPLVKWITGGDKLTARRMRQDFAEFEPTHKLWLAANHRPRVRGTDDAIWRRVKLIPFNVQIPEAEVDKHLVDKLAAEGPGILRWAVEGCLTWRRDGLGEPDEVRAATADYRRAEDRLGEFFAEACVFEPGATAERAATYRAYRAWAEEAGERPVPARELAEALQERGVEAGGMRGAKRSRLWRGVRLASEGTAGGDHIPAPDQVRAPFSV